MQKIDKANDLLPFVFVFRLFCVFRGGLLLYVRGKAMRYSFRWVVGAVSLSLLGMLPNAGRTQQAGAVSKGKDAQTMTTPPWATLEAAYAYNASKPLHVKERAVKSETAYVTHVQIEGPDGEKAEGTFMRPKAEGVYPVVLLLHGLTSDEKTMIQFFGEPLVAHDVAVLALDAPYHGERKKAGMDPSQPTVFPIVVQGGVREWRRALDYLAVRKDVDMKHVGLLGYSMGSMMGSILGAVDNRIGAFALCVGGDPILPVVDKVPSALRGLAYNVSPSLYVGHIAPRPILMLNGRQDMTMPEAASHRLYAAAQEPKEQVWYESGHILPPDAGMKAVTWVLGKVKAPVGGGTDAGEASKPNSGK